MEDLILQKSLFISMEYDMYDDRGIGNSQNCGRGKKSSPLHHKWLGNGQYYVMYTCIARFALIVRGYKYIWCCEIPSMDRLHDQGKYVMQSDFVCWWWVLVCARIRIYMYMSPRGTTRKELTRKLVESTQLTLYP